MKIDINKETNSTGNRPPCAGFKYGDQKGIALVMVLVLSAVLLAVMAALVYMLTAATQVSGIQKRYKTALEAGKGGAQFAFAIIGARGNPNIPGITYAINAMNVGGTDCLAAKLNNPTSAWAPACSSSMSIDRSDPTSYDMFVDLGLSPGPVYRNYMKIVDTVNGNSSGEIGLLKNGVAASNSGEVAVMSMPYLYTIEIDSVNRDNPQERGRYSILYEY